MDIVTVMQAYSHPKDIFILYAMCFEIIRCCFEKPNSILHCYSALLHFPAVETLDFKLAGNRYPGGSLVFRDRENVRPARSCYLV